MRGGTTGNSKPAVIGGIGLLLIAVMLVSPAMAAGDTQTSSSIQQNDLTQSGIDITITDTSSPVTAGDDLTVEVTASNNGASAQWQYIRLYDGNGKQVAADWVWLWNGQTKTRTLTWSTDASDYTTESVTVKTDDGSDTEAVTIDKSASSGINITITDTSSPVTAGDDLTAEVTASNNGADAQWQYVRLYDGDGTQVATDWVWLWNGQTKTRTLTWSTDTSDVGTESVTVKTDDGKASATVTVEEPNSAPTATAAADPSTVTVGQAVTLDASGSTDSDGSIESYEWDFGDGLTASGEFVNHTYNRTGSYNVTLTVTDGDGGSDTEAVTIEVCDTTDTDDDGLTNCEEETLGTDPTKADTDGDGLTDGEEAASSGPLADADPLHQDIFVEIDHSGHSSGSAIADALTAAEDTYAEAPVENPDGSTGIDLHIVIDDDIPDSVTADFDSVSVGGSVSDQYRDYRSSGYHYMVAETEKGGGTASYGRGVIGANSPGAWMNYLFMHEFGHMLGLGAGAFDGIDSQKYSSDTYNSVMNYNGPFGVGYNDGEPFDEWEFIEDGYTPLRGGGGCNPSGYWCPSDGTSKAPALSS